MSARRTVVICTDGACTANGREQARAGVGVYFGDGDPRNISAPLEGPVQTNNRAELTGILRALEYARDHPEVDVHIESDSEYGVKGTTKWLDGWEARGWKTSKGTDVVNQDLWFQIRDIVRAIPEFTWDLVWVKGHNGHPGNEAADKLATGAIGIDGEDVVPAKKKVWSRKTKREQSTEPRKVCKKEDASLKAGPSLIPIPPK